MEQTQKTQPLLKRKCLMKKLFVFMTIVMMIASADAQQEAQDILKAVVKVKTTIPKEARTAGILGTEREGNGVPIDSLGHILTIGYVILEADHIEVVNHEGRTIRAKSVGYDHKTGFGLIRADETLNVTPIQLGQSSDVKAADPVLVIDYGGSEAVLGVRVVLREEFTGYWEYLLDNAIYTSPPYANYGGAALIGRDGKLLGIGSIFTQKAIPGLGVVPCNMFVPIDLLRPILSDLITTGRSREPPQPWLGLHADEIHGRVFVLRVTPGGPAGKADIGYGDIILSVNKKAVSGLADFFRKVWALGNAGVKVPLEVLQGARIREVVIQSEDRYSYLGIKPK
jgi:S1-C subfamily serine protease